MNKIISIFVLCWFSFLIMNFSSFNLHAEEVVGAEVLQIVETLHPYESINGVAWEHTFFWPDAGYISIHFSKFDLAQDDYVIISSPDGEYAYKYKATGKEVNNGNEKIKISNFWATHIPGNSAIVRLYTNKMKHGYGFVIDKWVHGFEKKYINTIFEGIEEEEIKTRSTCSGDDKEWAPCYKNTTMYDKSRAVCRLLINGSLACTGWLLGSEGHVITNQHCINSQSDANNTDFEFMAEGETCSTSCDSYFGCPGTIEATSCTIIRTSSTLDYTLVLLQENISDDYGYLQLRSTLANLNERIYIPQHASGYGKQLAVYSDTNGPYAKIYSTNERPCSGGPGDIGYYADTAGGSSGSPVLSYDDNLVIALHHCANCPNRGVPIPSIIEDLGADLPQNSIGGNANYSPNASFNKVLGKNKIP
jgi:lysyl endopeptidase